MFVHKVLSCFDCRDRQLVIDVFRLEAEKRCDVLQKDEDAFKEA